MLYLFVFRISDWQNRFALLPGNALVFPHFRLAKPLRTFAWKCSRACRLDEMRPLKIELSLQIDKNFHKIGPCLKHF